MWSSPLPENHANGTDGQVHKPAKKGKKAAAFPPRRPRPAGVFDSVIAGADEVAENAFRSQGGAPSSTPVSAESVPLAPPSVQPGSALPVQPSPAPVQAPAAVPVHSPTPGDQATAPGGSNAAAIGLHSVPGTVPPATEVPARKPNSPSVAVSSPEPAVVASPEPVVEPAAEPVTTTAATPEVAGTAGGESTPEVSGTRAGVKDGEGSSSRKRVKKKEWAHQAVRESFADAKISSHTWGMHGFRIVPDVLATLKKRVARDRRTSGNSQLAIGHYLDAALRHAPSTIDEQVASAQAFLTERMGFVEAGLQSTYRIGPDAQAFASELNLALQEANYGRKGVYVVSAAVIELLRALEAEGDLQRPAQPTI
jgi:hypothetical protein